jgi:hypothetical protein
MAEEREYDYMGKKAKGKEIDFKLEKEEWNVYKLSDGTTLKVKTVVATIVRLNEYSPQGEPIYFINAAPAITADVPPELKKK